jgi:hypothetical protein
MTPTYIGRLQTRYFLLFIVGLPVTFFWALISAGFGGGIGFFVPFINLALVAAFGFMWDGLYMFLQSFRWDRDWPPIFQLGEGFLESFWVLFINVIFWGLSSGVFPLNIFLFALHYWSVFWFVFWMTQGPLRILFPRWRFTGGRIF